MNIIVPCDHHFERTPDGRVWTNGTCAYPLWTRYLAVFDAVRVVARIRDVPELAPHRQPADGPGVAFHAVPDFVGPRQFLSRAPRVLAAIRAAFHGGEAVILRAGLIGDFVERSVRRRHQPYGVEVVADPWDTFSPGAFRHPLRGYFRQRSAQKLRRQCAQACAVAYVTEHALQRRYPPAAGAFATFYSDVELSETAFAPAPRCYSAGTTRRLVYVGTLAQLYKAPEVLIDAVATGRRDGLDIELVLIGSGRYQNELAARASAHGLNGSVQFRGQLATPAAVREELDRANLFVLPSRQEGLPRAMVEAMARALPCIGSTVGGIPELLPAEDMMPPGDVPALAAKIREVITDPARLARMSARNLAKAREYAPEVLAARREPFYRYVREQTEAWWKR